MLEPSLFEVTYLAPNGTSLKIMIASDSFDEAFRIASTMQAFVSIAKGKRHTVSQMWKTGTVTIDEGLCARMCQKTQPK